VVAKYAGLFPAAFAAQAIGERDLRFVHGVHFRVMRDLVGELSGK
jgi:hypothetical protein